MKQTITVNQKVFITPYTQVSINNLVEQQSVTGLSLTNTNMEGVDGYHLIGTADITVELDLSSDEVVAKQVDTIDKQIAAVHVAAQGKINELLEQKSKLQSLTFTAGEAA